MKIKAFIVTCILILGIVSNANAEYDFNKYILKAVDTLNKGDAHKGYDINSYFTKEINYGSEKIKSNNSPKTMCVAAVAELSLIHI